MTEIEGGGERARCRWREGGYYVTRKGDRVGGAYDNTSLGRGAGWAALLILRHYQCSFP